MSKKFWSELGLHALGWALTFAVLWLYLGLWRADWRYPIALFAQGDGTYYAAQTKILLETGWVFHHPDLGGLGGLSLYDFAHFDALHLAIMKLIGYAVDDWAVVLNVFYVLTFLLATSTALALFRHVGMRPLLALCLAVLFSFQGYHFDRGQGHMMLAAYYLLPLQTFAVLWLLSPQGLTRGRLAFAAGVAFVAVFAGHYYTAFACLAYAAAAAYSCLRLGTWRPALQASVLFAVVAVGFALNLLPNALYWAKEGSNRVASAKHPVHVEIHSLRMAPLLLPVPNHRVRAMLNVREAYTSATPLQECSHGAIGLLAGAGLLVLLGYGLLGARREGDVLSGLGTVTLALILYCTLSGFGALFAHLVSPQMHGLNRVCILLALFGLLTLGLLATPWLERTARPRLAWAAVVLLAVLGFLDATPRSSMYDLKLMASQFAAHREFAEAIQAAVPKGTRVHALPATSFPFSGYDQFIPYLYTKGLRWTAPAMINRPGAEWNEALERLPAAEALERLVFADVGGLILKPKDKSPLAAELRELLTKTGVPTIESEVGKVFYDLRAYAETVRGRLSADEVEARRLEATLPVRAAYRPEFLPLQHDGGGFRWCTKRVGKMELVNHHAEPLRVVLGMELSGGLSTKEGFEVSAGALTPRPLTSDDDLRVGCELVVPPGRHEVTIAYRGGEPLATPHGPRWFRVGSFAVRSVRPAALARR